MSAVTYVVMAVASRLQRSSSTVIKATRLSLCPDVISSFVLAARVLTCRWVIKIAVLSSAKNGGQFSSSFFHLKYSCFESLANSAAMLAVVWLRTPAGNGGKKCVRTYSWRESNFLQSWMGFHLAAPLVPFQVSRGGPFVSPQGHLFTVAGTLWALVFHVRSSIRLVACGPPLTGVRGRPGIIAVTFSQNSIHFSTTPT